jgi:hypothetical protein
MHRTGHPGACQAPANVYQSTWYNIPETFNLEQHRCDTLKTHTSCAGLQWNLFRKMCQISVEST